MLAELAPPARNGGRPCQHFTGQSYHLQSSSVRWADCGLGANIVRAWERTAGQRSWLAHGLVCRSFPCPYTPHGGRAGGAGTRLRREFSRTVGGEASLADDTKAVLLCTSGESLWNFCEKFPGIRLPLPLHSPTWDGSKEAGGDSHGTLDLCLRGRRSQRSRHRPPSTLLRPHHRRHRTLTRVRCLLETPTSTHKPARQHPTPAQLQATTLYDRFSGSFLSKGDKAHGTSTQMRMARTPVAAQPAAARRTQLERVRAGAAAAPRRSATAQIRSLPSKSPTTP